MSRDMDAAVVTATNLGEMIACLLVDLDFQSGHVKVNSSDRSITVGSDVFLGVGALGKISAINEGLELQAAGLSLTLSGVQADLISSALGEHYQGRRAIIYLAILNSDCSVIGEPIVLFRGRMDNIVIRSGAMSELELRLENPIAAWQRPNVRRYNNDDQQSIYPGDKGLEFVEQAVNKEFTWGS